MRTTVLWVVAFATDTPDVVFLDCVQNTDDLVLRDVNAEVIYECDVDYDALGQEEGTCTSDYVDAKWDYCGCY